MTKPDKCKGCPLYSTGVGFAMGEGASNPRMVFIGEALGMQEAIDSRPFVGGTGKMLRSMIRQAGIDLSKEYITNVCKCQPPGNRIPTPDEIRHCTSNYLIHELDALKPNLIVAVGDTAAKFVMDKLPSGITHIRGSVFNKYPFGKILPIVHPSFVARGNPEFWGITVFDLIRAQEEARSREYDDPMLRIKMELFPTHHKVLSTIQHIIDNNLPFAFDLETIGDIQNINIMCLGLAWSNTDSLVIPLLRRGGYEYWPDKQTEDKVWHAIMQLMDSTCIKITQNGFTFDVPIMLDLGVDVREPLVDTLVAHHVVATELPHSLEFLTSVCTNLHYYKASIKGYGGFIWIPDEVLRRYNALDCIATYQAWFAIEQDMKDMKLI